MKMLFKLSSRNVKRSIKDYTIYFLTLVLGVCIFYVFNSLESQTIMMDLPESKKVFVELISRVISVVSGFVSCILGFLVIYANSFIIKKRNKEFGIYMTLGISKSKISIMLFVETIIIGILSLLVGIFIGVFLSQGLAGITAKLFEASMTKYQFVFSKESCLKTVFYFGIMFFVVMFLNFVVVSRYNLIDLIYRSKANQKLKGTNLLLSVFLFVMSIVCLAFAYKFILDNQIFNLNGKEFNRAIILGIIGTVLFFRALAGFLIKVTQSSKNYYLKNLNTFTLRQLNSKINLHYVSMSIICLMLFIAIGMSSTGIGMKSTLENTVRFQTPFDMSMYIEALEEKDNIEIDEFLKSKGIHLGNYASEVIKYNLYDNNIPFKKMFEKTNSQFLKKQIDSMREFNVPVIKISDYNRVMKTQGEEEINLKEDEVVLLTDMESMREPIVDFIEKNYIIDINNNKLNIKNDYEFKSIETLPMSMNFLTLIVDDKQVENMNIYKKFLSFNYKGNKLETESKVLNDLEKVATNNFEKLDIKISAMTKILCFESNMATANIFLFVGIYIGIVFLISSAAVLALSQLSGATESIERYKAIRNLGVSTEMINKSIFVQVLLYFFLPIGLALVHSICGIKVANNFIKVFGDHDMISNNIVSIGAILVVYGIYFIATYNGYKRIVNND
ncbi:ABC transporter permease [Clostridium sp. CCUG 7971]|uniref:FtsX-like permease family protein n=1 Tax=Clostridium sp. CCUG 7971 TaxID=2811414 RepID=UPI001ABB7D05|nr:ABC transporter permease [Clostridium sp. CCUG 7971]MBO3444294.1 ABC transporter permease [Clostridium sp. CCUG 7971]